MVRVHTGSDAALVSRSINARAFATGNDVFFGAGEYQPGTHSGRKLMAHELTHTLQQSKISRKSSPKHIRRKDKLTSNERARREIANYLVTAVLIPSPALQLLYQFLRVRGLEPAGIAIGGYVSAGAAAGFGAGTEFSWLATCNLDNLRLNGGSYLTSKASVGFSDGVGIGLMAAVLFSPKGERLDALSAAGGTSIFAELGLNIGVGFDLGMSMNTSLFEGKMGAVSLSLGLSADAVPGPDVVVGISSSHLIRGMKEKLQKGKNIKTPPDYMGRILYGTKEEQIWYAQVLRAKLNPANMKFLALGFDTEIVQPLRTFFDVLRLNMKPENLQEFKKRSGMKI